MIETPETPPIGAALAPSPADLQALIWLVAAGDDAAFRRLFNVTAPLLLAMAQRVTQDNEAAAEAVHGTMLLVRRGPARFDPAHGTAMGWLLALVRQRSVEIMRRRQRDGFQVDLSRRGQEGAADLDRLAADPNVAGFSAAFSEITAEERQVLSLAFLDGLGHAELAQRLRLPIGTVRGLVRQSLENLRTALEAPAPETTVPETAVTQPAPLPPDVMEASA